MSKVLTCLQTFIDEDEGATATEYAVMITLIILVCFAAVTVMGEKVSSGFVDAEAGW